MNRMNCATRYEEFIQLGMSGKQEDVDRLMKALIASDDLATSKLVDFALGLIQNRDGFARLRYYLFQGTQMQRNYAALYFKRKGIDDLLDEAVILGKIDREQAYSK